MRSRRAVARVKETPSRSKAVVTRAKPMAARPRATFSARGGVDAAIEALRDEVAALARLVAAQTDAIERARLTAPAGSPADSVSRLNESAELLASTAAELPRAEGFQPLADHLYAFAQSAPGLVERLEAVRAAVAPLEAAAASLAAVVKAVTPLPGMVQQVLGVAETLHPVPARDRALRRPLLEAADRMGAARVAIRDGLASLPRDRDYAQAAAHLRELATVSPSLMEWLRHLPALSLPLGDAVASLDKAGRELEAAERSARRVLEGEG